MEQIFSFIGDIVDKARSFKTDRDLTNFWIIYFISTNRVSVLVNGKDFHL